MLETQAKRSGQAGPGSIRVPPALGPLRPPCSQAELCWPREVQVTDCIRYLCFIFSLKSLWQTSRQGWARSHDPRGLGWSPFRFTRTWRWKSQLLGNRSQANGCCPCAGEACLPPGILSDREGQAVTWAHCVTRGFFFPDLNFLISKTGAWLGPLRRVLLAYTFFSLWICVSLRSPFCHLPWGRAKKPSIIAQGDQPHWIPAGVTPPTSRPLPCPSPTPLLCLFIKSVN